MRYAFYVPHLLLLLPLLTYHRPLIPNKMVASKAIWFWIHALVQVGWLCVLDALSLHMFSGFKHCTATSVIPVQAPVLL
jgi:hypothetical protein